MCVCVCVHLGSVTPVQMDRLACGWDLNFYAQRYSTILCENTLLLVHFAVDVCRISRESTPGPGLAHRVHSSSS